ncbi:MAG: hypothetical protein J6Y96_00460, partial [Mycoplasma sp.]|nr:hypothetical protein [Mycoplasma sp.]
YTGANLDDEIDQIKNSMLMNLTMMIKQYEIDKNIAEKIIGDANKKFTKYVDQIKENGDLKNDVVAAVQFLQENMVDFFDGVCEEMSLSVAQKQLQNFLKNVELSVKDDVLKGKDGYYWNELVNREENGYKKGTIISENDFNNIFDIKVENIIPNLNFNLKTKQDKMIDFSEDIITGYTLQTVVYDMISNSYENKYEIQLDIILTNNRYINDPNKKDKYTAHSAVPLDQLIYEYDENKDIDPFKINDDNDKKQSLSFELPITNEYEKDQLTNVYLTKSKEQGEPINITWSKSDDYGIDNFWSNESNGKGGYKGNLDVIGLANAGMMINNQPLIKILDTANMIKLDHGDNKDFTLTGTEGIANQDSNKWSLVIDDKEVTNDNAIIWELKSTTKDDLPSSISFDKGFVKWTEDIKAGEYNFVVIANFKETKIISNRITLTIDVPKINNEKITNNIKHINYSINNEIANDNDEISEKVLDFVRHVDFNLDYDEYDLGDNGVEKNEIRINSFNIGYKYHTSSINYSFDAPNSIKQNIYNQINIDSDDYSKITTRTSTNLYKNLSSAYQGALIGKDIREKQVYDSVATKKEFVNKWEHFFRIVSFVAGIIESVMVAGMLIAAVIIGKQKSKEKMCYYIMTISILILIIGGTCAATWYSYYQRTHEIQTYIDGISECIDLNKKTVTNNTQFEQKLDSDCKYFFTPVDNPSQTANAKELFDRDYQTRKQKKEIWSYYNDYNKMPDGYVPNNDDKDKELVDNKAKFGDTPYYQYQEYDKFYNNIVSESERIDKLFFKVLIIVLVAAILALVFFIITIVVWCKCFESIILYDDQEGENGYREIVKERQKANDVKNAANDLMNNVNDGENIPHKIDVTNYSNENLERYAHQIKNDFNTKRNNPIFGLKISEITEKIKNGQIIANYSHDFIMNPFAYFNVPNEGWKLLGTHRTALGFYGWIYCFYKIK